jgi:YD repeat-containing protein
MLDTSTRSVSYAYDGLLRLTDASESGATTNIYAYGYDLAGNRTSATIDDGTGGSRPAPTTPPTR